MPKIFLNNQKLKLIEYGTHCDSGLCWKTIRNGIREFFWRTRGKHSA